MATSSQEILLTNADLNLLHQVSKSIHSIHDLAKMLQNILLKIKEVFAIEGASIALHDATNKEFYFIRTVEEQHGIVPKKGVRCDFRMTMAWPAGCCVKTAR